MLECSLLCFGQMLLLANVRKSVYMYVHHMHRALLHVHLDVHEARKSWPTGNPSIALTCTGVHGMQVHCCLPCAPRVYRTIASLFFTILPVL